MRKYFAAILSAAAAWLLLVAMLLTGVFICTTSTAFYEHEYDKYDNAETIGVTDEGLMTITRGLLDYLWGTRDNLNMQAQIGGEMREVFSQREKDHMVDVRVLIELARNALWVTLIGGVAAWAGAVLLVRKQKGGLKYAGIGYLTGAALLFVCVGVVVLLAMQDFTAVFVKFHEIFFTNDLWLLNYDDMLIMMVPEPFFMDCAALIAIVFGVGFVITAALAVYMIVQGKKKEHDEDFPLTAVSGADKENYYKISNSEAESRPDAEEIFARMGLEDQDDEEDETVYVRPEESLQAAEKSVSGNLTEEIPVQLNNSDLSVRLEMKLDLKVEKSENGKLLLVMDPNRKPQVSLTSKPGQLTFTVADEPAVLPEPSVSVLPEHRSIVEPVPSPEELLHQMDELMKGFPKTSEEGDKL